MHGPTCIFWANLTPLSLEVVGCGTGELYAAQQNIEFLPKLFMPWIYAEVSWHNHAR